MRKLAFAALPGTRKSGNAAPMPRKTKPPRASLSAEKIVTEALSLVDSEGLDGFSFRTLAKRLGCEAMSIYYYFPGKQHLFDALVDRCIGEMKLEPASSDWLERLRVICHEFRRMALRHPGFFAYLAVYRMNSHAGLGFLDTVLSTMEESGLAEDARARHFRAIGYYLTGAGLEEAMGYARGPSAAEPVPDDVAARDYPAITRIGKFFGSDYRDTIFNEGLETLLAKIVEDTRKYTRR